VGNNWRNCAIMQLASASTMYPPPPPSPSRIAVSPTFVVLFPCIHHCRCAHTHTHTHTHTGWCSHSRCNRSGNTRWHSSSSTRTYGAHFSAEIHTRGCHWFPRHSSRVATFLPILAVNCVQTRKDAPGSYNAILPTVPDDGGEDGAGTCQWLHVFFTAKSALCCGDCALRCDRGSAALPRVLLA
jgi:hypothetical protein